MQHTLPALVVQVHDTKAVWDHGYYWASPLNGSYSSYPGIV